MTPTAALQLSSPAGTTRTLRSRLSSSCLRVSSRTLRGLHCLCGRTRNSSKNKISKQQSVTLLRAHPPWAAVALFPAKTALEKMRVPELLCVLACLCAAAGPVAGADKSCTDLRQFYTSKGFTLAGVPQTEISGRCERNTPNLQLPPSNL